MRVSVVMQREAFADVIDEALPLLQRHWREVSHYIDIPLDIDRLGYTRLDAAGLLRIYTVRAGLGGKLIGYAAYVVGKNGHYQGSGLQAKQDVIYVEPDVRGAFVGSKLVKFADEMLRAEGVQVVYQHVKLAHRALGRILERAGYEKIEMIYGRRLDQARPTSSSSGRERDGGEDANNARAADRCELH